MGTEYSQIYAYIGESGLGKSTLINTLFNTTLYPPKEPLPPAAERPKTVAIESIGAGTRYFPVAICDALTFPRLDIEENGVRLHLTVVDTPGFGDFVNNDERCVPLKTARSPLTVGLAGGLSSKTSSRGSTRTSSRRTASTARRLLITACTRVFTSFSPPDTRKTRRFAR